MRDDCWRQFCFGRQIFLFPFFIRAMHAMEDKGVEEGEARSMHVV
jgi:hypothetical protein